MCCIFYVHKSGLNLIMLRKATNDFTVSLCLEKPLMTLQLGDFYASLIGCIAIADGDSIVF